MTQKNHKVSVLSGLLFVFAIVLCSESGLADNAAVRAEIIIHASSGDHVFRVEVADTDDARERGLMYRRSMAPDAGMLFDYTVPRHVSMWMKNTYIALDMLFITPDGRIANIAHDTTPHSLDVISSTSPVRAVLELNAGTIERLGIAVGDRVTHAIFRQVE